MSPNRPPRWKPPGRYGQPAAIDGMGMIAAPFLAGIAIALAVLVISNETHFGAVGPALFALVVAAAALIACAECAFVARKYMVRPGELEEWWPASDDDQYRTERLENDQTEAKLRFDRWAWYARLAYNSGIVAFGFGVVFLLVPPSGLSHATDWRLAVFALACAGLTAEGMSIIATVVDEQRDRRERMRNAQRAREVNGAGS